MQSPYRADPGTPPTVIVYRTMSVFWTVFTTLLALGMAVGVAAMTATFTRTVTLDCSRAAGTCTVGDAYPIFPATSDVLQLSSIHGTTLDVSKGKQGSASYGVVLATSQGPKRLSSLYIDKATRQAQKSAIDAFLSSHTAPTLHVDYDQPGAAAGLLALLVIVPIFLVWLIWQCAILRIDRAAGVALVRRTRWPFRSKWVRELAIADIFGVELTSSRGRKGGATYTVSLRLTSGEVINLLGSSSSGAGYHERRANEIRNALGLTTL